MIMGHIKDLRDHRFKSMFSINHETIGVPKFEY